MMWLAAFGIGALAGCMLTEKDPAGTVLRWMRERKQVLLVALCVGVAAGLLQTLIR